MQFKDLKIAVVGVSTDSAKYGNRIFSDMIRAGWHAFAVNNKGGELEIPLKKGVAEDAREQIIERRKLYITLDELPEKPEIVVTVVPPAITVSIVRQAHELGVSHIWMQPGSESDEAVKLAESLGMHATHNACIMVSSGLW